MSKASAPKVRTNTTAGLAVALISSKTTFILSGSLLCLPVRSLFKAPNKIIPASIISRAPYIVGRVEAVRVAVSATLPCSPELIFTMAKTPSKMNTTEIEISRLIALSLSSFMAITLNLMLLFIYIFVIMS